MQDIQPETDGESHPLETPAYEPPSVTLLGSLENLTQGGLDVGDDFEFTAFS